MVWMAEDSMVPGKQYLFKQTSNLVTGRIAQLRYQVDVNTLHRQDSPALKLNEIGRCSIQLDRPIAYDGYKRNRTTGAFIVIDRITNRASWVSLKPVTGRQHQLRAHMAIIGHPIMADNKYNLHPDEISGNVEPKLHLHARRLVLPHPSGKGKIDVTAPLPDHMRETFELLGFNPGRYDAGDE